MQGRGGAETLTTGLGDLSLFVYPAMIALRASRQEYRQLHTQFEGGSGIMVHPSFFCLEIRSDGQSSGGFLSLKAPFPP